MRIRRENAFKESKDLRKLIFDFYVLEPLSHFAGQDTLNFFGKANSIQKQLEFTVERLLPHAREALVKSIFGEAKYINLWGYYMGGMRRTRPFINRENFRLKKCLIIFSDHRKWVHAYGGKVWAKACELALESPQTLKDKILWLDRLFDMQHNTGHLLNKTDFKVLEKKSVAFGRVMGKCLYPIKMLNFRYEANLKQLSHFSSKKVKGLLFANRNRIPKALFGE